jgi:hypothetical protein
MGHIVLKSESFQWNERINTLNSMKDSRLELFQINYDNHQWYRIVAVGSWAKDAFETYNYPTNIDHIEGRQEADKLFEFLIKGSIPAGFHGDYETFSKIHIPAVEEKLDGWTPNIYFEKLEGSLGQVSRKGYESSSDDAYYKYAKRINKPIRKINGQTCVLNKWAGSGGIASFDLDKIDKNERTGQDDDWRRVVTHEFKHMDQNRLDQDLGRKQSEAEAVYRSFEASLSEGDSVYKDQVLDKLLSCARIKAEDLADSRWASALVSSWMELWRREYPDHEVVLSDDPNPPEILGLVHKISHEMDEEITVLFNNEDLSDQEVAERMGLWDPDSDNLLQTEEEEEKEILDYMLKKRLNEIKNINLSHCRKIAKTQEIKKHMIRKSIGF